MGIKKHTKHYDFCSNCGTKCKEEFDYIECPKCKGIACTIDQLNDKARFCGTCGKEIASTYAQALAARKEN